MKQLINRTQFLPVPRSLVWVILLALLLTMATLMAHAGPPLNPAGYASFGYGNVVLPEPTGKEAESKLWWNDGRWWGILYNPDAGEFQVHWLDTMTQDWQETGVSVDDRDDSRADVLWDETAQKLYVASHVKKENPSQNGNPDNWGRLYRYSYDAGSQSYSLDTGFPVTVNDSITESLVLDKDSTGRLWVTYVSRVAGSSTYEVYVNASTGDDLIWGTPFVLPLAGAIVDLDDIATLVAFTDDAGPKIALLWSNQIDDSFYMAVHPDGAGVEDDWTLDPGFTAAVPYPADDHLNTALTPAGELLVVVKTGVSDPAEPLIALVARENNGTYSLHTVSVGNSLDTRPIVVVDSSSNEVIVFMVTKTDGGQVCYQETAITIPLSDISFPYENCPPAAGELLGPLYFLLQAPSFIGDVDTYVNINNPTSTKQMFTEESGRTVLATDDVNGSIYLHNIQGDIVPPPPPGDQVHYLPIILNGGGQ